MYDYYDALDDARHEAQQEMEAEAREALARMWSEEYPRHAATLERVEDSSDRSPLRWAIYQALEDHREAYVEDLLDDYIDAEREAALEARDPYAYRGLRRSDFI